MLIRYLNNSAWKIFLININVFRHLKLDSAPAIPALKVIYHSLYSMNNVVTNKSKLPQDGAQVFPYMGWLVNADLVGFM